MYQNESEFIQKLKTGDTAAFTDLYDRYSSALFGIISHLVQNPADAENLLQDTFVKIWRNIGLFDPEKGRLYTFMSTIARRMALDFLRSSYKVHQKNIQTDETAVHIPGENTAQAKTDFIGLDHLVARLDPTYKHIIDLIYFQGLTQQEVSDELNMPLGTVKSRCRAALMQLRSQIGLN